MLTPVLAAIAGLLFGFVVGMAVAVVIIEAACRKAFGGKLSVNEYRALVAYAQFLRKLRRIPARYNNFNHA